MVPHKKVIWKLESIGGLKGKIKEWMKDCLEGREVRTVMKDEIRMEVSNQRIATGTSAGTSNVFGVCE